MTRVTDRLRDPAAGVVRGTSKQLGSFQKFILRGNVVDLAVGIVIGAAFTGVVQALVRDFITPLISLFGGASDFSNYVWSVGDARFAVGDFVNALVSFLLIVLQRPFGKSAARAESEQEVMMWTGEPTPDSANGLDFRTVAVKYQCEWNRDIG